MVHPALIAAASPPVSTILANYQQAREKRGATNHPVTLETEGTLSGAALVGAFHSWHDANHARFDQNLGAGTERSLRIGERGYIENAGGNVRELHGLLLRRARTQEYVDSGDFLEHPEASKLREEAHLADGRDVYELEVRAPQGEPETVAIDKQTWLVDRIEYIEGDGPFTINFSDYRVIDGVMLPFVAVESDGDHFFDITQTTKRVRVNKSLPREIFAPFPGRFIETSRPLTVALVERNGHLYTWVVIHGHKYLFLVDTGAQNVVIDAGVAAELALFPEGALEARGSSRTGGLGLARLDTIHIGDAALFVGAVGVIDLGGSTRRAFSIDGILGYPFFASAVVRIDYANQTMTFAAPGMLAPIGTKMPIEVDREMPEVTARVNGIEGPFVVDTGNGNELLIFQPFLAAHPGLVPFSQGAATSFGIGGSTQALNAVVDQLDVGEFHLFNRFTDLIQTRRGAFADRYDAGNIGLGILKNFVVTFDENSAMLYLQRGSLFDDGGTRQVFR